MRKYAMFILVAVIMLASSCAGGGAEKREVSAPTEITGYWDSLNLRERWEADIVAAGNDQQAQEFDAIVMSWLAENTPVENGYTAELYLEDTFEKPDQDGSEGGTVQYLRRVTAEITASFSDRMIEISAAETIMTRNAGPNEDSATDFLDWEIIYESPVDSVYYIEIDDEGVDIHAPDGDGFKVTRHQNSGAARALENAFFPQSSDIWNGELATAHQYGDDDSSFLTTYKIADASYLFEPFALLGGRNVPNSSDAELMVNVLLDESHDVADIMRVMYIRTAPLLAWAMPLFSREEYPLTYEGAEHVLGSITFGRFTAQQD